ncbi:aminotransferase class IV [Brevundimonas sp.]|uniref:aminotransferase class IV n=1 Tax=Brevundimonas sp. TaxID=1871086 RepID=UPI0028AB0047|nr:aminotransferase class IV [Brevundimonas sp.]
MAVAPELWIDGRPAGVEDLGRQALFNYGALTSFRVEGGGVRGLDRHLDRLNRSAIGLFGEAVAEDRLHDQMRTALAGRDEAWLRISLFSNELSLRQPDWIGAPQVMISVSAPPSPLPHGVRLQSQVYAREAPHLKHVATMGLSRARRLARLAGFDDALFTDNEGRISEGSLWNVGFIEGETVVWPDAPMLDGVAQALIREALDRAGSPQRKAVVRLSDLPRFDGAFLCNSATPAAEIAAIDGRIFTGAADAVQQIGNLWRSQPRQKI